MELKHYLYLACGIGAFVMGRNIAARGGAAGPATWLLLLVPTVGLIALFSYDAWLLLRDRRQD